ncbi:MAG: ROK family protein [Candidatus Acidiferrales bacterium]
MILTVDLGGSHASCAAIEGAEILECASFPTASGGGLKAALPRIEDSFRLLKRRTRVEYCGIGFSFCGLVDPVQCRIISTNGKYNDGSAIDLKAWAADRFGLPLRLENDARLALLGERFAGAASGFDDVVMVTLGTGVGGAAMIGGTLVHGKHFQAGCLGGHFVVNRSGRTCTCGNVGCVEAEASSWALLEICRSHPRFPSSALADLPEVTFEALFRVADGGDSCAREIRDVCIETWAAGSVTMIHAYDPEVLILGGGLMGSAKQILPALQAHIEKHAWTPWGKICVRAGELGSTASLVGAASLFSGDAS